MGAILSFPNLKTVTLYSFEYPKTKVLIMSLRSDTVEHFRYPKNESVLQCHLQVTLLKLSFLDIQNYKVTIIGLGKLRIVLTVSIRRA